MYFSNRCISAAGSTDMPTTWAKKQTLPATPHRPEQVAGLLFEGHPARERLQTARCLSPTFVGARDREGYPV